MTRNADVLIRTSNCLRLGLPVAAMALLATVFGYSNTAQAKARFDFEQAGLASEWSAVRQITVAREAIPAAGDAQGPQGHGVKLSTAGSAGFICKAGELPGDLNKYETVGVWIYRSPEEAQQRPTSTIEFQFYEADGKTRFWAKQELAHQGWKKYEVPLKWFRWSEGRIPRWQNVQRMGIWFRDPAEVFIDEFKLTPGKSADSALLSGEDVAAIAFADQPSSNIKKVAADGIVVLSNASDLDANQLLTHLQKVQRTIEADLPLLNKPAQEMPLIVFADQEQFKQFFPRMAAKLGAGIAPPSSGGFTMQGVSASSWDPAQGTLRPVFAHEFVHALLSSRYDLPNKGEWLQEGLASYYQLTATPQPNFANIVRQSLANPAAYTPLETLCNGQGIPLDRYWQAVTVCNMLLNDEKYKAKTPELFAALRAADSTELGPHLQTVFGVTWDEFRNDWKKFCEAQYAEK